MSLRTKRLTSDTQAYQSGLKLLQPAELENLLTRGEDYLVRFKNLFVRSVRTIYFLGELFRAGNSQPGWS